ncbi:hypothetical protein ABZ791_02040 [Streptomyces huasconensis]|uniref:Uncharacterized protein n=1 Tax=Streptomyces huasconensis TaxID=1854574 RepID=A0ABV3LRN5_9ACTN
MGSPKPATIIVVVIATVVAAISGSLLSDRIAPYVPGGYITLGILLSITVIATLLILLLGGHDSPENLSVIRRRLSDTLGVVIALSVIAGAFWACVHYAPDWARAAFAKDTPPLNGEWSGKMRQTGHDTSIEATLELDTTSSGELDGTLTYGSKCAWALKADVLFPESAKEEENITANKERGPWQCPEELFVDLSLDRGHRISVKGSGRAYQLGRQYQQELAGVLKPSGARG